MTSCLDDGPFISAVLDVVIPPGGAHPGAGSLGLVPLIKQMLAPAPEASRLLEDGLQVLRSTTLEQDPGGLAAMNEDARFGAVAAIAAQQPALIPTLQMFLYVAYYQHPEVLRSHGLSGRPPFPEGRDIAATDESLLKKLRARANTGEVGP